MVEVSSSSGIVTSTARGFARLSIVSRIYVLIPLPMESISIILIMPIDAPTATKILRIFFSFIFLNASLIAPAKFKFLLISFVFAVSAVSFGVSVIPCLSSTICPSAIRITREEHSATCSEWVTSSTSFPSCAICVIISKICCVVWESREPVGSSATIISGSLINALAIATRCICPPDS